MKSLITLKVLLGLSTTVAILAVVLTGITQTHFSVETQGKELARESALVQGKVLESKDGSRRSIQNFRSVVPFFNLMVQLNQLNELNQKFRQLINKGIPL